VSVLKEKIECIIKRLISNRRGKDALTGLEIGDQFRPQETSFKATFRNLNAAFLICLCGKAHALYSKAEDYIKELGRQPAWKSAAGFYSRGISLINSEIRGKYSEDESFRENFDNLYSWCINPQERLVRKDGMNAFWRVFFPEGVSLFEKREHETALLREKRRIRITRLNPAPILDPAREILFTSNVLLTTPPAIPSKGLVDLSLPKSIRDRLEEIREEPQIYWYDHPIQIGTDRENNEAVYGLKALNEAIESEKRRGVIANDARIHCVLSVSVTHSGLRDIAKKCLEDMFEGGEGFQHLWVYAFSEVDVCRFIDEILLPAIRHYLGFENAELLHEVIGVDGEYGRHYSFLKSISAFWNVLVDNRVRATFKLDLDQVFPQKELVKESDFSALEHFKTPLWGAEGIDEDGNIVDLGMIAGALVNHSDIANSLFTPDVSFPGEDIKYDEWIFFSPLPQAISTEAEMMTRYGKNFSPDSRSRCIQRAHVTGGTCGILVKALRKHRPFTPCFIGRAEDQAYLLSVLFQESNASLRYVHKDGLIMRHDKEFFAGEAVRSASTGKLIGDYVRILLFSYYARALPWSVERVKRWADPFTGCFISKIPFTVVYLRLSLKAASLFEKADCDKGLDLLKLGQVRLGKIIRDLLSRPNPLQERYRMERIVWDTYFDALDKVEDGLKRGDPFALGLREKAEKLIKDCKL
jgi:hypothetical protein